MNTQSERMSIFLVLLICGNKQLDIHCKNKTAKLYPNNKMKFLRGKKKKKTEEILLWEIVALDYPSMFYNGLLHVHDPLEKRSS